MLIDASQVEQNTVLKSRVCIIGSGMGGSALAQKLAAQGQEVLLVEAGGRETHVEDTAPVRAESGGRPFRRPPTRCIELGGSSNQWHGICARLDEVDFETRPWVKDSGWPITRQQLDPFYDEACVMQGVLPTGELETSPQTRGIRDATTAIQFDPRFVETKLLQYRQSPRRWKNTLVDLANAGKLRCLMHATALELEMDPAGTRVVSLVAGTSKGKLRIEAEVFVVCAGALETPRLLLNSRQGAAQGIGNGNDLVGRYLSDHPAGNFSKIKFRKAGKAPLYAGMAHGDELRVIAGLKLTDARQRESGVPNNYFMIRPSLTAKRIPDELRLSFLAIRGPQDLTWTQIKAIITNPDILNRVLVTRLGVPSYYRYGDLFFFTEQLPNPSSRVVLSGNAKDRFGYAPARIEWQLLDADLKGFDDYTRLLLDQGMRTPQYSMGRRDDLKLWDDTVASAAHHVGTARMGASPRNGVVDESLKVFDVANLFVADGSVFPTAGSTNPSLTITALALRLGAHLAAGSAPAIRA